MRNLLLSIVLLVGATTVGERLLASGGSDQGSLDRARAGSALSAAPDR